VKTTDSIGTPGTEAATRLMLLGSGELGKEVAIEAQRYGVEVIAVDRYAHAPAMAVAHRAHVVDMRDGEALRRLVETEHPTLIVPEVEAIATGTLVELEAAGVRVVPTARATRLTMDREGIRRLAAEQLGLPTSRYRFASSAAECREAIEAIGLPVVVKPAMSSSGRGQVYVRDAADIATAFERSMAGARGASARVIVESFVDFEYELTLLTVRHQDATGQLVTSFCPPIGHRQEAGDYHESWQPHPVTAPVLARCQEVADAITAALGGAGLFGVELFVGGDEVWFSEVSPRPHDTGLVTLAAQNLSEFALHVRAILGLPIPEIRVDGAAASHVILGHGDGDDIRYHGVAGALATEGTEVRLFGKPSVAGERRLGVALARAETLETARRRAREVAAAVRVEVGQRGDALSAASAANTTGQREGP